MIVSDNLFSFFIPQLRGATREKLEALFSILLLEAESVKLEKTFREKVYPCKVLRKGEKEGEYTFLFLSEEKKVKCSSRPFLNEEEIIFTSSKGEYLKPLPFSALFQDKLDSEEPPLIFSAKHSDFTKLLEANFFLSGNLYRLKQLGNFWTSLNLFALLQELSLVLALSTEAWIDNFRETEDPVSSFVFRVFLSLQGNSTKKDYSELLSGVKNERPRSILQLDSFFPLFPNLKESWKTVISRLEKYHFSFKKVSEEAWELHWPYWYSASNLPPFSEILARLNPIDQTPDFIKLTRLPPLKGVTDSSPSLLSYFEKLKNYLASRGFVECNTFKFVDQKVNLTPVKSWLSYNKSLTLRDHLHFSMVEVLTENLNQGERLYPIFELSYCPWSSGWLLGLASFVQLEGDEQETWYSLEELKEILSDLLYSLFKVRIEFQAPIRGTNYLSSLSAALIFKLIHPAKGEIGTIFVHRSEQFELRKKEIVSVNLSISSCLEI